MTGSGKTAAFLLPILQRLHGKPRGVTRALILAPTRELAAQIDEHRRALARYVKVEGAAVFGGVPMGPQETAFRRGVDIIVATPGRLLDHLQHSYARLDGVEVLVLDEADRMLDMGFLPDIRRVLKALPPGSADPAVLGHPAGGHHHPGPRAAPEPALLDVERPSAPAVGVTHAAYPVASGSEDPLLVELLSRPGVRNALVFTRTKHRANRLAERLGSVGCRPSASTATGPRPSARGRWRRSRPARCACWWPPTSRRGAST